MGEVAHYLPLALGAASALALSAAAGRLTPGLRSRLYRKEESAKRGATAKGKSAIRRSPEQRAADAATKVLILEEHQAAIDLQNNTLANLMSVAASLTAAFICTVAAATVLRHAEGFHLFCAALDLTALGLVLWYFVKATRCRAAWIRKRATTEMLRQWSVVDRILIAGAGADAGEGFHQMKQRVERALGAGKPDFAGVVLEFGRQRLEEIGIALGRLTIVPADAFGYYLDRRPARQTRWFSTAQARISGQGKRHRRLLLVLFGFAAAAAALKVALLLAAHGSPAVHWTVLAILVLIGLSATLTSVYLNQNVRSLSHRYRSQSRSIAWWFERHAALLEAAEGSTPLSGPLIAQVSAAVTEFETLMLDELVDWIVITDHDSLEIAAA